MAKKTNSANNRTTPEKEKIWFFLLLVLVQFISIYLHNRFLCIFLMIFSLLYYLLQCDLGRKQKAVLSSGFKNVFIYSNSKLRVKAWLVLLVVPALVALYYFDFALLFWLLMLDGIFIYIILKKE